MRCCRIWPVRGSTAARGRWASTVRDDASPYNAVWRAGRLAGFIDWDMAGPVCREWDVAFAAFGWVPMHARHVAAREGFTDFGSRPRQLRRFLAEYGWPGTAGGFLDVVRARVSAHTAAVRRLAAAGDASSPGWPGKESPMTRTPP